MSSVSKNLYSECGSLAWCELYLILSNIFRKLDIEVKDPT